MTTNDQTMIAGDPTFGAKAISYRNALERANMLTTEAAAVDLYRKAITGQDTDLQKAITHVASQHGWDLSQALVAAGTQSTKARGLLVNLLNTATAAPNQLAVAEAFKDGRLTDQAQQDQRAAQINSTLADISAAANGIVAQIADVSTKASAAADAVQPLYDPNDTNQVARVGQAWQFILKPQLKNALPDWSGILDSLDIDGLFAVRRFGPAWIKSTANDPFVGDQAVNQVLAGIDDRIPSAVADPATAAILQNAVDAQSYLVSATQLANALSTVKSSRDATLTNTLTQSIAFNIGSLSELAYPAPSISRIG
jgi:hypothetical protein